MSRSAAKPDLVVREVESPSDRVIARAHALLKRTFPRAELVPLPDWRESLRERSAGLWTDLDWHLFVAERGGKLVGAATGSYVGNINVGLVGYVAVIEAVRSLGVGGRLRGGLRAAFLRDARRVRAGRLEALIGEVHLENPWLVHLVRRDRVLALRFPYYQPSLHVTADAVELVFYYQPVGRKPRALPAEKVRRMVYTIWRRIYRVDRPLAHPEFRRMLAALRPGTRIGARGLPGAPARRRQPSSL